MQEPLLQIGVGGIFVVLVLRMVFDFLQARKNGDSLGSTAEFNIERRAFREGVTHSIATMKDEIHDLHMWHSPNEDGEQNWKNTRMITVLEDLHEIIKHNTDVIDDVRRVIENKKR